MMDRRRLPVTDEMHPAVMCSAATAQNIDPAAARSYDIIVSW
jgi:hypothetical protein